MRINLVYAIGATLFLLGIIAGMATYSAITPRGISYPDIPSNKEMIFPQTFAVSSSRQVSEEEEVQGTLSVDVAQEFSLQKREIAIVGNEGLSVQITDFINSPCELWNDDEECVWPERGVEIEYSLHGETQKGVNLIEAFGYYTTIVETDYKTYAILKVEKI